MAAYRQVYDSRHLLADYQELGSAPEPYVRQSSMGYLYFFTSDYLRYVISWKTICNPLSHPTWKCTTLTCEVPNFFYLTEGLQCTCIFRTCVFHPCEMRCFVPAFSSTCVFSAPLAWLCLERGADLYMAQLMPLPLTVCCFSKIQIGFTFLVPAHLGSPGNGCVCVCVIISLSCTVSEIVSFISPKCKELT